MACPSCGAFNGHVLGCSESDFSLTTSRDLAAAAAPSGAVWSGGGDEERFELWVRTLAVPAALSLAWLVSQSCGGKFLLRTFSGMWMHELGHAVAAWLCGYFAIPGPWVTSVACRPSVGVTVLAVGALVAGGLWLWRRAHPGWAALCGVGLLALAVCTVGLGDAKARTVITFCGDAGGLLFGAVCMMVFAARRHTNLYRGGLRWGLLLLGAGAFVDLSGQWLAAREDFGELPLGEINGVGLSDASKLLAAGWSEQQLVSRYLVVAGCAFAGVVAAYVFGLLAQRARMVAIANGEDVDEG